MKGVRKSMFSFCTKYSSENLFIVWKISKIFSWSYSNACSRESILSIKISILSYCFLRTFRHFFKRVLTAELVPFVVYEWWSKWSWRHSEERNCLCLVQKVLESNPWHLHFKLGPRFSLSNLCLFKNSIAILS